MFFCPKIWKGILVPLYTEDGELFKEVDGVLRDLLETWLLDEDLTDVSLNSCGKEDIIQGDQLYTAMFIWSGCRTI